MIPNIASCFHGHVAARVLDDNQRGYVRAFFQGRIGVCFERNFFAAAYAFVCGDDAGAFTIHDAPRQSIGGKSAKHHRVHSADARAGQHGVGSFHDHRHIDGHPVTLFNALGFEHIGEGADLGMKLLIGDVFVVSWLVAFPNDSCLGGAFRQVTVNAIYRGVEGAVCEPLNM